MQFILETKGHIEDDELSTFLKAVYVESGFTDAELAKEIFLPSLVRERGDIYLVRESVTFSLAGLIIVVSYQSKHSSLSLVGECEFHLLGVLPQYRGHGIAKMLVSEALKQSCILGYKSVNLCTQSIMKPAHKLYEKLGFTRNLARGFVQNGREFWVYECGVSA